MTNSPAGDQDTTLQAADGASSAQEAPPPTAADTVARFVAMMKRGEQLTERVMCNAEAEEDTHRLTVLAKAALVVTNAYGRLGFVQFRLEELLEKQR